MRISVLSFLACLSLNAAHAATIDIALTDDRIAVDTSFSGARLTLFGALTGLDDSVESAGLDMIAIVRGPPAKFRIRQIQKNNLIWTPGEPHHVSDAPGLYLIYATGAVNDIVPLPLQAEHRLDADFLEFSITPNAKESADQIPDTLIRSAFLTEVEELGLYGAKQAGIEFKSASLFTIEMELPANTPVGDYFVTVYLMRDGVLLSSDNAKLAVNRAGLERQIYEFAHERPIAYGLFCVALSLFAGWIAALAFRK